MAAHGFSFPGWTSALLLGAVLTCGPAFAVEICTTQSQMKPVEREGLAAAALRFASDIQKDNETQIKGVAIAELQGDFASVASLIESTSARVKGATAEVEQIYLLDASTLSKTAGGGNPDAQFFCTLNQSQTETTFSIPQLPPGRYGFAMVRMEQAQAERISMLLRQENGRWLLAGLYPKALSANGHDGLWYWKQARTLGERHENWNAWLYLQEAQSLLVPAGFVSSTHLEKLAIETTAAAPTAIGNGLSAEAPLVVKGADGAEYRFTAITADDALGPDKLDITAHLKVETLGDANAARTRNTAAMAALLNAHPELRTAFHGVFLFADAPGAAPYGTELAMAEIH